MYTDFYQLKEKPFNITADPDFFFSSQSHREAFSNLMYGIENQQDILVITGEVGTGKTTLCRKLMKKNDNQTKGLFIQNLNFSEIELLQMIAKNLGVWFLKRNKMSLLEALNKVLLKRSKKNLRTVLIIDEAQKLSVDQLESIRLLSNFETEKEKLLTTILIGQPELRDTLKLNELRQLRQRIAIHFHLQPLEKKDIPYYIHHRLSKATNHIDQGCDIVFTDQAIESIYHHTSGLPRSINILCDRVLLAGFVAETFVIDAPIIHECAKEILYCEYNS